MMRKRALQWAVMTLAVPGAAAGARRISQRMEARRGPSGVSGLRRKPAAFLHPGRPARRRRFGW